MLKLAPPADSDDYSVRRIDIPGRTDLWIVVIRDYVTGKLVILREVGGPWNYVRPEEQ